MPNISIVQIASETDVEAARDLVRELFDYALSIDPHAREAHAFEGLEDQLAELPGIYGPPDGAFLLARVDGDAAGCVGSFAHDSEVCEVKRMYVRPGFRGLKLGETLTAELINLAKSRGFRKMVLDSFHTMKAAHNVYASLGFEYCAPRIELPETYRGKVIFMDRAL